MAATRHGRKERRRSLVSIYCVWLAALVVSTEGDCGPPKQLANASIKDEVPDATYTVGSTVTYVCNEAQGYVQSPGMPDTIKCLEDSTWSEIQEFCQRSCKFPTRFDFAEVLEMYINQNVFPVGTNVTYKCRPGYVPLRRRSNTITCLDTLQWSTVPEFCERKDCGNPGEPMNGGVNYEYDDKGEVDTKFGSEATFFCNPGFNMLGRKKRTCAANGWTNAVPKCEAVICQQPPDIVDGTHSSAGQEEFNYQASITYSCNNKQLWLIGEASIHCTQYGNWSGPAPECKAVRCSNPDIPDAVRTSGFGTSHSYRDSITFKCRDGFVMNGSNVIQCGADNEWNPPVPTCRASVVTCSDPPRILNGEHSSQPPFHVGASVTYRCKSANFNLHGDPTIRCQSDGTWSSPTPECKAEYCELPNIPHGKTSEPTSSPSHNDIIEIMCDSLYTLHGESRIQCGEDKQWQPVVPECYLSSIFIACIILLVFLVILAFFILCYCYNKKKQGSYPTNEQKVNGPEAIHLRDESQNINA
ncbi:membrane cofactor protein-like isoform X2 [Lissotriton helveticus]